MRLDGYVPDGSSIEDLVQSRSQERLEIDVDLKWRQYLSGLGHFLEDHIVGQSVACQRISQAIQAGELGLNDGGNHPKSSFLFLGPTGVGKTESAKCFTQFVFGSKSEVEIVFMNEYSADFRLGEFLGRVETAIRRHPGGTTLLFDEIEKANPGLIDIFLSFLEEGQFTTLKGERLSIVKFYVVLTSNLGSADLAKMENAPTATLERVATEAASQSLRPELFARIIERIIFRPLGLEAQKEILDGLIAAKLQVLANYFSKSLSIDRGPVTAFLLRVGYNRTQGVRMLRQEVDRQFNLACLDWALDRRTPQEGRFYYNATVGRLTLK
jgi:ATP-dependent Clp protease ATP-binding subunit ClpA